MLDHPALAGHQHHNHLPHLAHGRTSLGQSTRQTSYRVNLPRRRPAHLSCQRRNVPSRLPLARTVPSGLNATVLTIPVWPVKALPMARDGTSR